MAAKIRIAIYMRLSHRDKKKDIFGAGAETESNSITNQRLLLSQYAEKHFSQYELLEFCDDGYSGTNLNRPAVSALLKLIKNKEVDCIIVKDFSRFSRDYIDLGCYIEHIFPFLEIRFISIGDRYDSMEYQGSAPGLATNFKQLLYDLYSKDLSVKVKASIKTKKDSGKYLSANSPFGYRKDPADRHKLIVKDDEALIVKKIFALSLQGLSSVQIAKSLNEEGVLTPVQFRNQEIENERKPKGKGFEWCNSGICHILRNEVYVGSMVQNKYTRQEVGGKNKLKPRAEWTVVKNHHEAMIEQEVFERVQNRGRSNVKVKPRRSHPLSGKCVCGGCQKNLQLRSGRNPYYECKYRYTNGNESCIRRCNQAELEELLLEVIRQELLKYERNIELKAEISAVLEQKVGEIISDEKRLRVERSILDEARKENYTVYAQKGRSIADYLAKAEKYRAEDGLIERKMERLDELKKKYLEQINDMEKNFLDFLMTVVLSRLSKELSALFLKEVIVYQNLIEVRLNYKPSFCLHSFNWRGN